MYIMEAKLYAEQTKGILMYDRLIFSKPSEEWLTGTPVGNGRIGFMQFGEAGKEIFALNCDSLFRRKYKKKLKTAHLMETIREKVAAGQAKEAQRLFGEEIKDEGEFCNPYQPFGDLVFEIRGKEAPVSYSKTLNMAEGMLYIGYQWGKARIAYEAFADAPEDMIVIRLTSSVPVDGKLSLTREADGECRFAAGFDGSYLYSDAEFDEGLRFSSAVRLVTDAVLKTDGDGVSCEGLTFLEAYVALEVEGASSEGLKEKLKGLEAYSQVKKGHIADHRSLYDRVSLRFEGEEVDSKEAYERALAGEIRPETYAYLFNMARYCLISSSREGSKPINLQGLWCHDREPAWDCGYTTDINVEMCYWPAEILGLAQCEKPLFEWIQSNAHTMKEQAESIFGVQDGVYIPQYTDLFMTPTCWESFCAFQVLWSGAAPWLAQHYFSYWRHTCDDAFMKNEGYPFMKKCANFYMQMLTLNQDGKYVLIPGTNPENWTLDGSQLVNTCTMDASLIHEIMQNLLYVNEALGLCDPDARRWQEIDEGLVDYVTDEDGALCEFTDGNEAIDSGHRHLSHVYGLFPATLFESDPRRKEEAWKAVKKRHERGVSHASSWSMAWTACCASAVGDGDMACEFINHIIKSGLMENYLTVHNDWRKGSGYCYGKKIFQIDALMGISRAIANMFVCNREGAICLLPALPDFFPDGSIGGLCAYGGFSLDLSWKKGRLCKLLVSSNVGAELCLAMGEGKILRCSRAFSQKEGCLSFGFVPKGETVTIELK